MLQALPHPPVAGSRLSPERLSRRRRIMDRMTTTIPQGLSETRAMALAMFEHQVPCFFQLAEPCCQNTAKWLAFFEHEEPADGCEGMEPWPLCDEHRRAVAMTSSPFWRMWMDLPSSPCAKCETPVRVARMEGI